MALEGALKLKEISYIHAEAYAAGELKHGTLALIIEGVPVIALATQTDVCEKTLSNIKEVKARDAVVIGIGLKGDEQLKKIRGSCHSDSCDRQIPGAVAGGHSAAAPGLLRRRHPRLRRR